jgi:ADP-heptose:LPS heptosyltransferase
MLNAIRKRYPAAHISWAVESPTHRLLNPHPAIDDLILVPKGWLKKPSRWRKLFRFLREPAFDVVIDPQGITKSAALGRISGAKMRIGIRGRWGRELSPYLNNVLVKTNAPHIVDRSLELLTAIDIEKPAVEYDLPICPDSRQTIDLFLREHGIVKPFVVINPGASWKSKRWETDRFAAVACHLSQMHGVRSIISWAGEEERAMAERIVSLSSTASLMAPATSLRDLAALCQSAIFFIGCDTGPLHLAAAVGTPCIGLYGPTKPTESGAYGLQHLALQKWYQEGSCRQRRNANNDAMRDIEASEVNAACSHMLNRLGVSDFRAQSRHSA